MDDDDCRETDSSEVEKMMGESHEIRIRLTKKLKRMLKYVGFHPPSVYITCQKLREQCFGSTLVSMGSGSRISGQCRCGSESRVSMTKE
jgi:hypothetical protein